MQNQMMFRKVFVAVLVQHGNDGKKIPVSITFEDGKKYEVDQLIERKRAAASKVGGTGIRYTIRIRDHQTFLFEDEDMWFVEARDLHT